MNVDDDRREWFTDGTGWLERAGIHAPARLCRLPDGRPSLVIGAVEEYAAFNHRQGDNPENDCGDCGVVSCADVLDQFGERLTEAELVGHATRCRELHLVAGRPDESGWTLPAGQVAILHDYGVPAHAAQDQSLEDLAAPVQRGRGVIATVNAGALWSDAAALGDGGGNHVVTVTGIAREPYDGALQGFFINDSGNGQSAQFISAHLMTTAFVRTGGFCVITDVAHAAPSPD